MIADTSFLIDIMANEPSAVRKASEIESRGLPISVGAPTIFELYVGVALGERAEAERRKVTAIVASLPQLPLDSKSARVGGIIYAEKSKAGSKIDPEDAMIAGIAKVAGETIITRNVKHFSDVEGVTTETY